MKGVSLFFVLFSFAAFSQNSEGGFHLNSGSSSFTIKSDSMFANYSASDLNENTSIGLNALIGVTNGRGNTAIGISAMRLVSIGLFNTAIGAFALNPKNNTNTLLANTAVGTSALGDLTIGTYNTAFGDSTLLKMASGNHNTVVGFGSMANATNASFNVAVGNYAGNAIATGTKNVVIGNDALKENVQTSTSWPIESNVAIGNDASSKGGFRSTVIGELSGTNVFQEYSTILGNFSSFQTSRNTSIGLRTLNSTTFPSFIKENTILGNYAMQFAATTNSSQESQPKWNTAIGHNALKFTTRQGNVAIGESSMTASTLAEYGVALGHYSGFSLTFGRRNTIIGNYAGYNLTTGVENVIIGDSTAFGLVGGNRNTLIGRNIQVTLPNITNTTVIGSNVQIGLSNVVQIGNPSVASIGGFQPFTTYSDRRTKENIVYEKSLGLAFIKELKTAKYNYREDVNVVLQDGLIAQDIATVLAEKSYRFPGLSYPKTDQDQYSVSYSMLVIPLISAIQEIDSETEQLLAKKAALLKKKQELLASYEAAKLLVNQSNK